MSENCSSLHKKSHYGWWLTLFITVLLLYCTFFFCAAYFLSESLVNNNRWISAGLSTGLTLVLWLILRSLNVTLSDGVLGAKMQKLRINRLTDAFVSMAIGVFLAALIVLFVDDFLYAGAKATHSYGSLGVIFVVFSGFIEYFSVFFLFEGRGISRL